MNGLNYHRHNTRFLSRDIETFFPLWCFCWTTEIEIFSAFSILRNHHFSFVCLWLFSFSSSLTSIFLFLSFCSFPYIFPMSFSIFPFLVLFIFDSWFFDFRLCRNFPFMLPFIVFVSFKISIFFAFSRRCYLFSFHRLFVFISSFFFFFFILDVYFFILILDLTFLFLFLLYYQFFLFSFFCILYIRFV